MGGLRNFKWKEVVCSVLSPITGEILTDEITLEPQSKDVSKTREAIRIRSNSQYQISLLPEIVNNFEHPECCIKGKIIAEKKNRSDQWDNPLRVSSLKPSEYMEISLSSEELWNFYKELQSLFASFDASDAGSFDRYIKFDGTSESVRKFFDSNALISFYWRNDKDRHDLISLFSDIICSDSKDRNLLIRLISSADLSSPEAIELLLKNMSFSEEFSTNLESVDFSVTSRLRTLINLSQFEKTRKTIEKHLYCSDEKRWQAYFEKNKWVLEQLFPTRFCYFIREMETGNPDASGKGSNTVDFAFRHGISNEISIVEIKPPSVPLLIDDKKTYRNGVYKINPEIVYAISQLLQNKYKLFTEFNSKAAEFDGDNDYRVFDPLCILLVGNYESSLSDTNKKCQKDKQRTFDQFRRGFHGIQIVTYDELLSKMDATLELISNPDLSKPIQIDDDNSIEDDENDGES